MQSGGIDRRRETLGIDSSRAVDETRPPPTPSRAPAPDYSRLTSAPLPPLMPPADDVPLDRRSPDVLNRQIDSLRARLGGPPDYIGRYRDEDDLAVLEAEKARRSAATEPGDVGALARARGFTLLPPDTQRRLMALPSYNRALLADELDHHGGDPVGAKTLAQLAVSKGFQLMSSSDQERLLRYVGSNNPELSRPAQLALADEMTGTFNTASPEEQKGRLERFMRKQPGLDQVAVPKAGKPNATGKTTGPANASATRFDSGVKPARRYEVEIDGRKIPVMAAASPPKAGSHVHTPEEVRQALERMPKESRDKVKIVHLDNVPSPDDPKFQKKYDNPAHITYMTGDETGLVSIYPFTLPPDLDFMVSAMIHEAGHIDSMSRWGRDSAGKKWIPWQKAIASDEVAGSVYAKKATHEDYGETYRLYIQTLGTPKHEERRKIMPERFKIIDENRKSTSP